jgi:hypothetical protein
MQYPDSPRVEPRHLAIPQDHGWRTLYCEHCGHMIKAIVDCGHRFCPFCCRRRLRRIRAIMDSLFAKIEQKPKAGLKMITLSTSNCKELEPGVDHLVSSFRRLRQRVVWKSYVIGGCFVIEIKGRPGNWHPHIHAIVYAYYIPWSRLRAAWRQCSGGLAVWINAVTNARAKYYVTKYTTKPEIPAALADTVSTALRRYRLFTRFGDWHNIAIPPPRFETPCERCGHKDWIVDFTLDRVMRYG